VSLADGPLTPDQMPYLGTAREGKGWSRHVSAVPLGGRGAMGAAQGTRSTPSEAHLLVRVW